jgi:hypothetical protein
MLRRIKGKNLLQTNFMLPPVGQVIPIDPRLLGAEVEVTDAFAQRKRTLCLLEGLK